MALQLSQLKVTWLYNLATEHFFFFIFFFYIFFLDFMFLLKTGHLSGHVTECDSISFQEVCGF